MLKAVYPGSFDPLTLGHLDVIKRAASIVDVLIVSVLENPNKQALFTVDERRAHILRATKGIKNVVVDSFRGLTVDFAKSVDATVIIRGLRSITDFEAEFQMAHINKSLDESIETLFISASTKHSLLSSSAVKEVASFGGNISFMVPEEIRQCVLNKYKK